MKSTLLDKSFRILEKIALSREPVTLKELASDLELNTSTVSRIASDLTERNLIRKSGYHSFVPSIGLFRIGNAAGDTPLIRAVSGVMEERLAEMGVNGVFAGIDGGYIVHMYEKMIDQTSWMPSRLPVWKSNLAALLLGKRNDQEMIERFFYNTWKGDRKDAATLRECELLRRRCAEAAEAGHVVFKDPRLGWSISFPVEVSGELYGISIFGKDIENSKLELLEFECSRLASKLSSVLGELFY